jgi:hypothetical protein
MFQSFINSLADQLAEAFIAALRPKLRALVDDEIAHAKQQLQEALKPITDRADQALDAAGLAGETLHDLEIFKRFTKR